MSYYILVEVADRDTAHNLISYTLDTSPEDNTIVGLYKKPTKLCPGNCRRKFGWQREPKYHWWLCTVCNRPAESWAKQMPSFLGNNLLNGGQPHAPMVDFPVRSDQDVSATPIGASHALTPRRIATVARRNDRDST